MNLRSNVSVTPVLRLVGSRIPADSPAASELDRSAAMRDIARENRAASLHQDLDPNDPRWVLAARTRNELQGAALPADRRTRLLGLAYQLGMRPFDANLVIAIVQDEARLASAGADSTWELAERLRIIPQQRGGLVRDGAAEGSLAGLHRRGLPPSLLVLLSALLGVTGLVSLLGWLMAG